MVEASHEVIRYQLSIIRAQKSNDGIYYFETCQKAYKKPLSLAKKSRKLVTVIYKQVAPEKCHTPRSTCCSFSILPYQSHCQKGRPKKGVVLNIFS